MSPYIPTKDRAFARESPQTPGELNYAISMILLNYIAIQPATYAALNDCLGALEGAKAEFYRRVVVPFEEGKKDSNGDIY